MSSHGNARFLPGVLISDRWRVVARLGAGGMGEVYRADDLRLGEAVALKFLPERLERDPALRERFLGEAKLARKVSHPNVCRVFDLGEVDGRPFLSMEYVDGEDLGTLLSRIGRLPPDKAVQVAREICAGLAAAHAQGILHRDLKPTNVMLDGRGHARITDFGLATIADATDAKDAFAGTPAYMAPEQLRGELPSRASDVYALGLVLYEIFTGHRAFDAATPAEQSRLKSTTTPNRPSSLAPGIDPATERVILRCLAPDPAQRPPSVGAIAAGLPGGDPLAAALAAGETPSPELVAAGVGGDTIPARAANAWLALGVLMIVALVSWVPTRQLLTRAPLEKPPAVLLDRARAICDSLGWTARKDDYSRLVYRQAVAAGVAASLGLHDVSQADPKEFQRVFGLAYWSSPTVLRPLSNEDWTPIFGDPAPSGGFVTLMIDGAGNLSQFQAIPFAMDSANGPDRTLDLAAVLRLVGFADTSRVVRATPLLAVPAAFDRRDAWRLVTAGSGRDTIHAELASYRGRVVNLVAATVEGIRDGAIRQLDAPQPLPVPTVVFDWTMVLLVLVSAWRAFVNLRTGRADARGAVRVAVAITSVAMGANLLVFHRNEGWDTFPKVVLLLLDSIGRPMLACFVLYAAFEPVLRNTWPHLMVAWARVLDGRWRDTRVGADVLVGTSASVALFVAGYGLQYAWGTATHTFMLPGMLDSPADSTDTLMGGGWPFAQILLSVATAGYATLTYAGALALVTSWTRQRWVGSLVGAACSCALLLGHGANGPFDAVMMLLLLGVWTLVMVRLGLVGGAAFLSTWQVLRFFPMVTPGASWYWPVTAVGLAAIAVLLVGGYLLARGTGRVRAPSELAPAPAPVDVTSPARPRGDTPSSAATVLHDRDGGA